MPENSRPPKSYQRFVSRYPKLGEAWESAREAELAGPADDKTRRLLKLAVAVGAMRQGAVTSAARKALDAGADQEEILQIVALAATTLGFPASVAVYSWIEPILIDRMLV
jgi:alkylhydroperoxidase/carboxymuconolactone decarboxylase family protein YurZ